MQHSIRRTTKQMLLLVKIVCLGAAVALAWGIGAPGRSTPTEPGPNISSAERTEPTQTASAQRLLDQHACSAAGFGAAAQPQSAVIRSGSGKLRFVDFETGWEVYTDHGEATLVAVCLDQPPS